VAKVNASFKQLTHGKFGKRHSQDSPVGSSGNV
jgi:hypothetical protein